MLLQGNFGFGSCQLCYDVNLTYGTKSLFYLLWSKYLSYIQFLLLFYLWVKYSLNFLKSPSYETLCSLRTVGGHGGDDGGLAGAVLPGGLRGMLEAEGHARGAGLQAQGSDERGDGGQGQQGRRHRQEVRRREAALLHIVSGSQSCKR